MANKFLRLPIVSDRTGLPKSTIYLRIAQGTFPRPIRLGERSVGWLEEAIEGWLNGRIDASRQSDVDQERVGRKGDHRD